MTIQRMLNTTIHGGNYTTWYLSEVLLDAGWTVAMSCSGTGGIYSATADVFDRGGANPVTGDNVTEIGVGVGDEHWGNARCWMVLEDPDGNRQWCFYRDNYTGDSHDDEWAISYSKGGLFTGGSTSVPPTATDQQFLAGEDGYSGADVVFRDGTTTGLVHIAADDTASSAGEYGFILIELEPTNTLTALLMQDDLQNTAPGDTHPLTVYIADNDVDLTAAYIGEQENSAPSTWLDEGGAGEQWSPVCYGYVRARTVARIPGSPESSYDGKARSIPGIVGFGPIGGYLGLSRWIHWPAVVRSYPNTADSETKLFLSGVLIPDLLDGSTTPVSI